MSEEVKAPNDICDVISIRKFGVLSKKDVFKWCIHVSAIQSSEIDKRSDLFSFGPSSDAKFYLLLPAANSELSKQPFCSASQFNVFLCRVWKGPDSAQSQKQSKDYKVKVSLALLDLRDRLHHSCERIMQDTDRVHATFDRSCYDKYHLTFLRGGLIGIHCALDVDEVIQEDADSKESLLQLNSVDEFSTMDLIQDFSALLENGLHSDLTLVVGEKDFRVHRAILSARSPVFAAMFDHDTYEKNNHRVLIEDVSDDAISQLLHFLYTGQTGELTFQAALSLFVASDKYNLPKLKQKCSKFLCSNLTKNGLLNILVVANMHEDENLRSAAIQGVLDNAVFVMKSDEWLLFLKEYPELANNIILQLALKSVKD